MALQQYANSPNMPIFNIGLPTLPADQSSKINVVTLNSAKDS